MWQTLSSKEIFHHSRLTLIEDEVVLPNGDKTTYLRYRDDIFGGPVIIVENLEGKILIQKEYCYPIDALEYFFPGGIAEPHEDPMIAANRELTEEAGLYANTLDLLGWYYFDARRWKAKAYVYHTADFIEKNGEKDAEESIESLWLFRDEICDLIRKNTIHNPYFLAAWNLFISQK